MRKFLESNNLELKLPIMQRNTIMSLMCKCFCPHGPQTLQDMFEKDASPLTAFAKLNHASAMGACSNVSYRLGNLNTFQLNPAQLCNLIGFRPIQNDFVDVWALGRFWRKNLGVLRGFGPTQSDLVEFLTFVQCQSVLGQSKAIWSMFGRCWWFWVSWWDLGQSKAIWSIWGDLGYFGAFWVVW